MIIPEHNYTQREQTVVDIVQNLDFKSFINVGFRFWDDPRNHWWVKICDTNNINWSIVEIFEENVSDSIQKGCPDNKIILGNIIDVYKLPDADCLLFWHGPEHVEKNKFLSILPELEKKYNILIFGMPLGYHPQGICHNNPFEEHISVWTTEDWTNLGYITKEVFDQKYPHITSYKINLKQSF